MDQNDTILSTSSEEWIQISTQINQKVFNYGQQTKSHNTKNSVLGQLKITRT